MKDYIRYEDMPPSAQKAYNSTNSTRKLTMFVGGFGFIAAVLALLFGSVFDAEAGAAVLLPAAIITMIPGFVHAHLHFKKFLSKAGIIGLAIWFIAVMFVGGYGCVIFLAMDIVRYIQKKPLISKSEHLFFLESPAAQQEMMAAAIADITRQSDSSSAAENLRQLKGMLDSGIITEAEFNAKKAELLERM